MLTLTEKEFNKIYTKTSKSYTNAVYQLYKKTKFGMELCNDVNKVKELFVYLMALSNWTQAEFTGSYFYNCLNKEQIYNIYKEVKKLN